MLAPSSLLLVVLLCSVVAYDYRVLRKLLEEAFWGLAINEEVEGLYGSEDGAES